MCNYTQWKHHATHREKKMIFMFGELHLEKALLTTRGDFLNTSGWTEALTESRTAQSFLKVSHITRGCAMPIKWLHAKLALAKLQQDAFKHAKGNEDEETFENWRLAMVEKSPTFQYWDIVKKVEIIILIFVRSHRDKNFVLLVEVLESLMFLFFAMDHYNYSRWVGVHFCNMTSLPPAVQDKLKDHWVIVKTNHRFSAIPIDQTHEQ